jgi:thiamine-monophosphate kinase
VLESTLYLPVRGTGCGELDVTRLGRFWTSNVMLYQTETRNGNWREVQLSKSKAVGGEEAVLQRIREAFAPRVGSQASTFVDLGIGDDAALLRPGRGFETVLTCDWFLEGTHLLRDKHPADSVGWKCLARAVSDVAAMGGVPRCFLLSLALPKELVGIWLEQFLGGLWLASRQFKCELAGGDTTARSEILINVTVLGEVRKGRALLRSGAQAGDLIYVSGRLGEAELGWRLLRERTRRVIRNDERLRKHLYPQPRLELGRWLSERRMATAAMDLSDGLSSDLGRMCEASGVGALVDVGKLPLAKRTDNDRTAGDAVQLALHGGDDYELLFTVSKRKARRLPRSLNGVAITAVGEITGDREVLVATHGGKTRLEARGWDPFKRSR